jgi:hypothetical protein
MRRKCRPVTYAIRIGDELKRRWVLKRRKKCLAVKGDFNEYRTDRFEILMSVNIEDRKGLYIICRATNTDGDERQRKIVLHVHGCSTQSTPQHRASNSRPHIVARSLRCHLIPGRTVLSEAGFAASRAVEEVDKADEQTS